MKVFAPRSASNFATFNATQLPIATEPLFNRIWQGAAHGYMVRQTLTAHSWFSESCERWKNDAALARRRGDLPPAVNRRIQGLVVKVVGDVVVLKWRTYMLL